MQWNSSSVHLCCMPERGRWGPCQKKIWCVPWIRPKGNLRKPIDLAMFHWFDAISWVLLSVILTLSLLWLRINTYTYDLKMLLSARDAMHLSDVQFKRHQGNHTIWQQCAQDMWLRKTILLHVMQGKCRAIRHTKTMWCVKQTMTGQHIFVRITEDKLMEVFILSTCKHLEHQLLYYQAVRTPLTFSRSWVSAL